MINPHTSGPPTGVLWLTITRPDLATAGAYATSAFAMGTRAAHWTATLDGYEADGDPRRRARPADARLPGGRLVMQELEHRFESLSRRIAKLDCATVELDEPSGDREAEP